jgi:hypothetical protein
VRKLVPRTCARRSRLHAVVVERGKATKLDIALLPWAADELKRRQANAFRDQPSSFCLPDPTPTAPLLQRFVQTPTMIVALFEEEPHYRQAPGEEILEDICAGNNKYVENAGLK